MRKSRSNDWPSLAPLPFSSLKTQILKPFPSPAGNKGPFSTAMGPVGASVQAAPVWMTNVAHKIVVRRRMALPGWKLASACKPIRGQQAGDAWRPAQTRLAETMMNSKIATAFIMPPQLRNGSRSVKSPPMRKISEACSMINGAYIMA
jgi:hypothetical protein